MEKKLTNSGLLREPADKHSIYMCWEITNHGHAFLRGEHACEGVEAHPDYRSNATLNEVSR